MPLLHDIVSYWSLDETSGTRADFFDQCPLSDTGSVGSGTGKFGNAASFASGDVGSYNYLSGSSSSIPVADCTISFWFKVPSGSSLCWLVSRGGDFSDPMAGVRPDWEIYVTGGVLTVDTGGSSSASSGSLSTNTWYHAVVTIVSSGIVSIKINDGLATTGSTNSPTNASNEVLLGKQGASGNVDNPQDPVLIDDLAIWSRVLTSLEITALYNSGSGRVGPAFGYYLAITQQPTSGSSGSVISPSPAVEIVDESDTVDASLPFPRDCISVEKLSGSGTLSTSESPLETVSGVAIFDDLVITGSGSHVLRFTHTQTDGFSSFYGSGATVDSDAFSVSRIDIGCTAGPVTSSLSATFAKPTYSAVIDCSIGHATAALTAFFRQYTANITPSIGHATASLAATFTKPVYTAAISCTANHATTAIAAIFTGSFTSAAIAATAGPVSDSLSATFTKPVYTAAISCTANHATTAIAATFTKPVFTSSISETAGPATASLSSTFRPRSTASITAATGSATSITASLTATFVGPTYHATISGIAATVTTAITADAFTSIDAATLVLDESIFETAVVEFGTELNPVTQDTAEFLLESTTAFIAAGSETHFAESSRSAVGIILYGVSANLVADHFKLSPTATSFRRNGPQHVVHLTSVKPQIATIQATFQLLTASADLDPGEFLYESPGSYLTITNVDALIASIIPDTVDSDAISVLPTTVANGDTPGAILLDVHQPRILF